MARISRRRLALMAAASATLPSWARAQSAPAPSASTPSTGDVLAERLKATGVGLVVAQVAGGQVTVTARGDARAGTPITPEAVFEIGSITKTFTALLLADDVVAGRLKLEGAVEDVLGGPKLRDKDGLPLRWADIATHRSGLPRLPGNMKPASTQDPYADYGEAQLLEFLAEHKPTTSRQTDFGYSNLGYGLLGYALAKHAGKTYEALLTERVLKPLGLDSARLSLTGQPAPARLVPGHAAERQVVPHWRFDVLAPCGALLMDAATLARYAQAAMGVFDHPLKEAFALALKPRTESGPPTGLGWLFGPLKDRQVANHDGGTFGFSTSLIVDAPQHKAALVLSNCAVPVQDLAVHLVEPSIPPRPITPVGDLKEVAVDAELLKPLAGRYALNADFRIEVTVRDGQLWAQATKQKAFPLFATGPRRFFAKVTPLVIEFPGEGVPTVLKLSQSGAKLDFKREP